MLTFGLGALMGDPVRPLAQRGGMGVIIYQGLQDRWFIPLLPRTAATTAALRRTAHLLVLGVAERRFDA